MQQSKGKLGMRINCKCVQWLVFWLGACLSFVVMAAAAAPFTPVRNFPFTEPQFERVSEVDMLDAQVITALAQDARGLIWIGTQKGLVRYDGYRFRRFVHNPRDPLSLAGDYIFSLWAGQDGRIWIGTSSDGVSVFDPATERFENFQHDAKNQGSLGAGTIRAITGDERGGIWIATEQGLNHLPVSGKRFIHFKHGSDSHSLLDDKVRSLLWDKTGRLWVGSFSGLQRMTKDGKSFETMATGKEVRTLFQAQDGKLWLGTREHGVAWLMPDTTERGPTERGPTEVHWLPLAQLSHPWVDGIAQVQTDQIWLASTGGGIIVVAASDGHVLQTLRHDVTLPGNLALDSVKPLLLDRAGWLWVGTWGAGLQRMNANNTMLRIIRHSPKQPGGLSHPDIRSVLELANGQLLFGSEGNGIDIFDQQRGLIGAYRPRVDSAEQTGALPDTVVKALAQTPDGTIWAGTQQAGLLSQLAGNSAWVAAPDLPSKQISKLLVSRDGTLWVGTTRGAAYLRPGDKVRFETLTDENSKPMQSYVYAIVEDGQGRIWLGTANGLWVQEPGHRGLIAIPAEPNHPAGLVSNFIPDLLFDSQGRLWVGTEKGLERLQSWDGKRARFEHVSALLGQPGKALGGNLMEDNAGRIWTDEVIIDTGVTTGLTTGVTTGAKDRAANATAKMRSWPITQADGMSIGSSWNGSYGKTRDGLLLFGGTLGVAIIDPSRFKPYVYAPPVVAVALSINGQATPLGPLVNVPADSLGKPALAKPASVKPAATLTLTPEQRSFSLEFAALDYSDPKKNRYQYRLQGYDQEWINTDADYRSANYANLWPGSYTLQVRGSNRLGVFSPQELRIPVRILPAWWQTWWFGLVLLLGLMALIAALVQTRTRYLRQRQHVLEQQVAERTSELHQKQLELVDANHDLNESNTALNESNTALNESNAALNDANADLALSVETLRQLGDIGRDITANLDAEIVFQSLYLYVGGLLDAPAMTIYRINAATKSLDAVFGRDDDQVMPMRTIALDSPTSNAARVVRERQELLLNFDPQDDATHIPGTRQMLTALFAPLIVDDQVLGVMSVQSDKQNAYGERERLIFRNLTAYGAIALANAAAVAALHQAQGQLVQQEKMASLGGLVAGIAHEINTPLGTTLVAISGVEGAWQTLQTAIASGHLSKTELDSCTTEGMEYTALALKTATRAAELIALFKTISVNTASDRSMAIELPDYLEELATLVRTQLTQNGCKLEITATPGLCIHVVPDALTEALSRILVNVLNHAFADGRTGTLRLCAQADTGDEGDEVVITVSDDGHGIAPEDLPKVFDPFFTTKSGMHGHVGLGLHVAYNHVTERLKGKIQITSTLGEGTCVEIRLKKPEYIVARIFSTTVKKPEKTAAPPTLATA